MGIVSQFQTCDEDNANGLENQRYSHFQRGSRVSRPYSKDTQKVNRNGKKNYIRKQTYNTQTSGRPSIRSSKLDITLKLPKSNHPENNSLGMTQWAENKHIRQR